MNDFSPLLDRLIAEAPDGAAQVQIFLADGGMYAGALFRAPESGIFTLRTAMRRGDARSGPVDMVDIYFRSPDVRSVVVPVAQSERSGLVTPDGSPVVPRIKQ